MVAGMPVDDPQLGDVAELDVLGNLLRRKMAVIVDDGHHLRMGMIELPGGFRLEHEVIVDEGHIVLCYVSVN